MATDLDSLQHKLTALTDLGVKKALAKGATEAEAFVSYADIISVTIEKAVVRARQGSPCGIGMRVVANGKVGFAAASGLEEAQIGKIAEEAVAVARIRPLDPDFKHLPDPVTRPARDGIIDDRLLQYSEKDTLAGVDTLAKTTFQHDKRIKSLEGEMEVGKAAFAVANSRGISASSKGSYMYGGIYCIAVKDGRQKTGSEFFVSRELADFSEIGIKAADRAVRMLEAKPLGTSIKTTTLWENRSISYLLGSMLKTASNARNVQEGKSYFKEKIGEEVASNFVTIADDGQLPEGLSTQRIDAEGVPMQTTTLIDRGVLKTHLYDSYAALRENKESSGSAKREEPEPFLQTPTVSTSNLVVTPGRKNLDELVAEVDKGILITDFVMGIGHANTITGEFSVVAPSAFLVEKGEIIRPLEPVTVAGNFFHALKNVQKIGCDTRLLGVGKIPSILIGELTVSG
ncbi:MAG: TldD/PmbA family protein [Candidatus Bathyarchaeota archaeon]|nr:TldD/PmbA family protein [Candidatus Bathyarchaeota archaeon]